MSDNKKVKDKGQELVNMIETNVQKEAQNASGIRDQIGLGCFSYLGELCVLLVAVVNVHAQVAGALVNNFVLVEVKDLGGALGRTARGTFGFIAEPIEDREMCNNFGLSKKNIIMIM